MAAADKLKPTAVCTQCEQELPRKAFWARSRNKNGLQKVCIECTKASVQPERVQEVAKYKRDRHLLKQYGLTEADVDLMRQRQEYKCAVCDMHEAHAPRGRLYVDHSHMTGKVRKLLCHHCNVALGHLRDDRAILARLDQYLKDHA